MALLIQPPELFFFRLELFLRRLAAIVTSCFLSALPWGLSLFLFRGHVPYHPNESLNQGKVSSWPLSIFSLLFRDIYQHTAYLHSATQLKVE